MSASSLPIPVRYPSGRSAGSATTSTGLRSTRLLLAALFLVTATSSARAEESDAKSAGETPRQSPWNGTFRLGPLVLDPEVRIDSEWRRSEPAARASNSNLGLTSKRIGIEGRLGKRLGFDISAELTASSPWRNVRADYRLPGVTVSGGQFKVPFSLDGALSASDRDFVFRSRLGDAFSMGRDRGVSVETRLLKKRVSIEGGVFARDGDRAASDTGVTGGAKRTGVLRITTSPLARGRRALKDLRLGISAASSQLDEVRSALTLRTVSGRELTSPVYWASGVRRRAGVDVRWRPGPLSLTAEYLSVADERQGQGNGNEDLAPFRGAGWYVEGTWFATGEAKAKNTRPGRPLHKGGLGAIEIVGRAEYASLGVPGYTPGLAASPRATQPALSDLRVFTTGLNWHPVAGARLQFNVAHETIGGATAASLQGMSTVFTSAVRFQLFI